MSNNLDACTPKVFAEGAWLQGSFVTIFLYGIVVCLSVICWRSLWPRTRSHNPGYKKCRFFFGCVTFLFVLATIFAAFVAEDSEQTFIQHRLFPGGPSAFAATAAFSYPDGISFLLSDWCAQLLMIWRCIVVYRDTKFYLAIFVIGGLMFVGPVVIGILWLIAVRPRQNETSWLSLEFLFPYLCLSLATTVFISLLTVLRLLYHRHKISKILGRGHGAVYASFAAIIIESAAVYSICSLLYLITFVLHNPLESAFTQVLGEAQVIASLLILFHVVQGGSWTYRVPPSTDLTTNSIRMRPIDLPQTPSPSAAPNDRHLVNITFDQEVTRNECTKGPRYSTDYAGEHAKKASAPVDSAV